MNRSTIWIAALALAACGQKSDSDTGKADKPAATPAKSTEPAAKPATPENPKPPWSTDFAPLLAKLQGSWLVKGFGAYGAVSAWKFDGSKVLVYDPSKKKETPDAFIFESPCGVRLDSGYGGTLVIDGDDVYLGLGGGGWKQGDTVIACMGSGTVYATKTGCATYKEEFGKYKLIDTKCTLSDSRFVATENSNYGESSLRFFNDHTLLTDQLAANKLAKSASWDEAKAAADKAIATKGK